jgi:hypothetical protein
VPVATYVLVLADPVGVPEDEPESPGLAPVNPALPGAHPPATIAAAIRSELRPKRIATTLPSPRPQGC